MPKKQKRAVIFLIVFIVIVAGAVGYSIWANRAKAPTVGIGAQPSAVSQQTTTTAIGTAPGLSTCVILDQQYCDQAKLGGKSGGYYIGFNLPPSTKIYAPFDGVFITSGNLGQVKINGVNYQAGTLNLTSIMPPNEYNPTTSTPQFIVYAAFTPESDKSVKRGELLGEVGNQKMGNYNLIVYFNTYNTQAKYFTFSDLSLAKQYFPNL
jgi:hypothetical protein